MRGSGRKSHPSKSGLGGAPAASQCEGRRDKRGRDRVKNWEEKPRLCTKQQVPRLGLKWLCRKRVPPLLHPISRKSGANWGPRLRGSLVVPLERAGLRPRLTQIPPLRGPVNRTSTRLSDLKSPLPVATQSLKPSVGMTVKVVAKGAMRRVKQEERELLGLQHQIAQGP
jgi:hypothetical protein